MANPKPTERAWLGIGLALLALAPVVRGQSPPMPPPPPPPAGFAPGPAQPAADAIPVAAASPAFAPPAPVIIPPGLDPQNRDPFWPVGYRPKTREELELEHRQAAVVAAPLWEKAQSALRIGGTMRTPQGFTALINNELVKPGDIVSLIYSNQQYRWKIEAIALAGVSLSKLDVSPLAPLPKNSRKDNP